MTDASIHGPAPARLRRAQHDADVLPGRRGRGSARPPSACSVFVALLATDVLSERRQGGALGDRHGRSVGVRDGRPRCGRPSAPVPTGGGRGLRGGVHRALDARQRRRHRHRRRLRRRRLPVAVRRVLVAGAADGDRRPRRHPRAVDVARRHEDRHRRRAARRVAAVHDVGAAARRRLRAGRPRRFGEGHAAGVLGPRHADVRDGRQRAVALAAWRAAAPSG